MGRLQRFVVILLSAIAAATRLARSWTLDAPFGAVRRRAPAVTWRASARDASGSTEAASRNFISIPECLNLLSQPSNGTVLKDGSSPAPTRTVHLIDGSWYHKGHRNGRAEFLQGPRIANSIYFDLDDLACTKALFPDLNPLGLSHMQPPVALLAAYLDALAIEPAHDIVLYGSDGAFLPRIWLTLRHVLGHTRTRLLRGSLTDWMAAGGPVEHDVWDATSATARQRAPLARSLDWTRSPSYPLPCTTLSAIRIIDGDTMKAHVANATNPTASNETLVIVDTRGSSFAQGHMPNAVHVPYSSLYTGGSGLIDSSRTVVLDAVTPSNNASDSPVRVVVTCGSGVSVCSFVLALDEYGLLNASADRTNGLPRISAVDVYDGSWEEWDTFDDVPKVVDIAT